MNGNVKWQGKPPDHQLGCSILPTPLGGPRCAGADALPLLHSRNALRTDATASPQPLSQRVLLLHLKQQQRNHLQKKPLLLPAHGCSKQ
jgi:hypothetical protein